MRQPYWPISQLPIKGNTVAAIEAPHSVTAKASPRETVKREATALVQIVACTGRTQIESTPHSRYQLDEVPVAVPISAKAAGTRMMPSNANGRGPKRSTARPIRIPKKAWTMVARLIPAVAIARDQPNSVVIGTTYGPKP